MSFTYTERVKCTENFASTISDVPDAGVYDRWNVFEQGKLAERWLVVEKGQKHFVAEITSYRDDENV